MIPEELRDDVRALEVMTHGCNKFPTAPPTSIRTVAVLCAAKRSVYKNIQGCDVYDVDRDARTFSGGMPVVAHPPCRLWSAYCAHQAKSADPESEKALGIWCANQVMEFGGALEQPAHSRLWDPCRLPKPGWEHTRDSWSVEFPQFWFGDAREKNTWVYFRNLSPFDLPPVPFRLKQQGGDRRVWQLMSSKNAREATPQAFRRMAR